MSEPPGLPGTSPFSAIGREIAHGLSQPKAEISPKYFYNVLGSKLFEAICRLDEYYLTRCETVILARFAGDIARRAGSGVTLIDLGAGNCEKAERLFDVLQPVQYVPIDISERFLQDAVAGLRRRHPALPIVPLGIDFTEGLVLPGGISNSRRLFFYPGSSLGNFTPVAALQFLRRLRQACAGPDNGLLIGIDLVKEASVLEAAYDDALGVTAAFNRNVLLHVNEVLGADFDPRGWRHIAWFNSEQSRIEMHVEAVREVRVRWPGGSRLFAAGERIHTENSYKYTKQRFQALLFEAGFGEAGCWSDDDGLFLVCHAPAV